MTEAKRQIFMQLLISVRMGLAEKTQAGLISEVDAAATFIMLDALEDGRFHFAAETWHDAAPGRGADFYPSELLLRARTLKDETIKPFGPINTLSQAGLQEDFDKAIILAGIDQALRKGQMPISINTSARNMKSAEFWQGIRDLIDTHFDGKDIFGRLTFEVTEDDLADNPCREVLLKMKYDIGCTFAIDDFYHDRAAHIESNDGIDSNDWKRLDNLRGIVDYVKIDGETIEASLREGFDLQPLIDQIKKYVPDAHIITERVENAEQAYLLANAYGVDAVQGLYLTEDRKEFQNDLRQAAANCGPQPKYDCKL